jgi:hypothetical protein
MENVEVVESNGRTFAIILRSEKQINGVEFYTPKEYPFQMGAHFRKKGETIKPHAHRFSQRTITTSQEMLHVDSGRVEVDIYDDERKKILETVLKTGDTILFVEGGHGFKFLEDTKIVEVKQGPYEGVEKDKDIFGA